VTDAFYSKTVRLAPAALSLVQDGDHLAASPWTLAAFAQGHRALASWDAYARVDFQYGARQGATVPNSNARNGGNPEWFAGVPAQSSTALRLGARRAGWDVSLFVQNLFDTRPRLTVNQDVGLGAGGTPLLYVISWRPRTAGLTAAYRY
jgi:iron complex outermembrane recepter protein